MSRRPDPKASAAQAGRASRPVLSDGRDALTVAKSLGLDSQHWLYRRWAGIKSRCYNPKAKGFEYYGGKGVRVAPEWLHDFGAFARWSLDNGAAPSLQIDRVDGNGDYSPGNCRWVTRQVNLINRPPKSEWNWGEAARKRYQQMKDDDDADLLADGEAWEAASLARGRAIFGHGMSKDELRAYWSRNRVGCKDFSLFARRVAAGWRLHDAAEAAPKPRDGRSKDWLYSRWIGMFRACAVEDQGFRIVTKGKREPQVCDLWHRYSDNLMDGFQNFREWAVSVGAAPGSRLVRLDPEGDFTPENCRFVRAVERSRKPAAGAAGAQAACAGVGQPKTAKAAPVPSPGRCGAKQKGRKP